MKNGSDYIFLYRDMLEWQHFQQANVLLVWIAVLLKANWKDGWFKGKKVERGELITSLTTLQEVTGLSKPTITDALNQLRDSGEIEIKRTNHFTRVKVVNFSNYQTIKQGCVKEDLTQRFTQPLTDIKREEGKNCNISINILDANKIADYLRNESTEWHEMACRRLNLRLAELAYWYDEFQLDLQAKGVEVKTEKDAKEHFINWVAKQLKSKNNGSRTYQQSTKHTDPRELVNTATNIVNAEKEYFSR